MLKWLKNKLFPDQILELQPEELIDYIEGKLENEKSISDTSNKLWEKYNKLPNDKLLDEKDTLKLRKVALENAIIENTSSTLIMAIAVIVALISIIMKFFTEIHCNIIIFITGYIICTFVMWRYYRHQMIIRAKEIAYCTLALDVIERIQWERNKKDIMLQFIFGKEFPFCID